MNSRCCPYCDSSRTIKFSKQNGKQRYRCKDCLRTWQNKFRPSRRNESIWHDYCHNFMPIRELAKKYQLHPNTIRKVLREYRLPPLIQKPRPVSLIMDTTYFSRCHGELMVVDPNAKPEENFLLYQQRLSGIEKTLDYIVATDTIQAMGYEIKAVVIDGRRGVREYLLAQGIEVQMCHFHQKQIIKQCLTSRPKLPANLELKAIADGLRHYSEAKLELRLNQWQLKYSAWLAERYVEASTGRRRYVHARTRRAFFSLKHNLPFLYTYKRYPELKIPNTTNKLDSSFGVFKNKLKAHHGITDELKTKMLFSFLSEATGVRNN